MSEQRTIVITGASDGIGAAAARALATAGNRIVVVGRNPERTARVADEIGAEHLLADFSRFEEVRRLAARLGELDRIDVLANNAGGVMGPRTVTEDGHELTWQVNYLAPFLLTMLLMPKLTAERSTVINTSSAAHLFLARFNRDDPELEHGYSPSRAYGNAKLADLLFAAELDRHFHAEGLRSASFHPGIVATSFGSASTKSMGFLYQSVLSRVLLTPEQGASTLVWLAQTTPGTDWPSGRYFAKRKVARPSRAGRDRELSRELWDRTREELAV